MTKMNRRSFLAHSGAALAVGAIGISGQIQARPGLSASARPTNPLIKAERAAIVEAMGKFGVEGCSVCLVEDGKPSWIEGFGTTGNAFHTVVDDQTIFSIQSTSKNVTAVAVLLAVQEGLLNLDAPISRYLPAFRVSSRFESKPQDRITLRLLLSHRAGFTHEAPVGNNYEPGNADFAAHVKSISETWLRYPVGERYRYSNLGHDLAGFILQEKTGMPFAQWLRKKLFEPLGMLDSTADASVYTARDNRAVGHEQGYEHVPAVTPLVASGGVYTSARDMARYSAFHLSHGRKCDQSVLDPALWQQMHAFGLGGDYGLGVIRNEVRYGDTPIRILSHKGGGFGFGCVFIYCPEANLAWTAMFNRPVSAPYRFGQKLIDGLLAAGFGAAVPRLGKKNIAPISLTSALKKQVTGSYVGRSLVATIGDTNDRLQFDSDDLQIHGELMATSPTTFFTADGKGELAGWTYISAVGDLPAHLECTEGEAGLDYNEGPDDPKGPDRAEWSRHLGKYVVFQWGKPSLGVVVERRNGYLVINGTRLVVEREPGLFFTSDGEAVDFRSSIPTWRSLLLRRA